MEMQQDIGLQYCIDSILEPILSSNGVDSNCTAIRVEQRADVISCSAANISSVREVAEKRGGSPKKKKKKRKDGAHEDDDMRLSMKMHVLRMVMKVLSPKVRDLRGVSREEAAQVSAQIAVHFWEQFADEVSRRYPTYEEFLHSIVDLLEGHECDAEIVPVALQSRVLRWRDMTLQEKS